MSKEFWTRDNLVLLCQLFELKPVLWNVTDTDYKNKYKRKDALDSIAVELGINNVDEVKKRIESLLVQYRREKKIATTSGMGTDEKKKPWWGMQYLQFLGDKTTPRPTFSNSDLFGSQIEGDRLDEDLTEHDVFSFVGTTSRGQSSVLTSRASTPAAAKHLKRKKNLEVQEEAYTIMKECYEGVKRTDSDRDEYCVYADHLAGRIRKIKNKKRLCMLKHQIENLIFKAEMEEIEESPEPINPARKPTPTTLPARSAAIGETSMEDEHLDFALFGEGELPSYTSL